MRVFVVSVVASVLASVPAASSEFWPGVEYDSEIPTFESVLGHAPGEDMVSHADISEYLGALAEAAPDRIRCAPYGETWESRELLYCAVGSAENIGRLDEIQAAALRVADPRTTDSETAMGLMADLPATVWLAYGVHGNEISSPDAALFTAYHLLAAQSDAVVDEILGGALVFIDPTQNPDGRDRFVHHFRRNRGIEPDPSRISAVHSEPWPGGRTNHYFFDLNRDWFALTQPETQGRIALLREWLPLVFVDLHEMGGDSTYYFAPEAVPYNPHLAADQRANLDLFGKNNSHWFDTFGFDYFTREVYDAFYPGYGASWPSYYGAVAMTYEQASARGLAFQRTDGDVLTFAQSVRQHFVASVSTAQAGARHREKLWKDFRAYRESAIEEGQNQDVRSFLLPRTGDTSLLDRLAELLDRQGIEVDRVTEATEMCSTQLDESSYVISAAQPAKRLIRNLLDDNVPMEDEFLVEQERRRSRRLGDQIYDVTAWSLAMMWNVDVVACSEVPRGSTERASFGQASATPSLADAKVGYLVPWGTFAAGELLTKALREGLVALSPELDFDMEGRTYPAGSYVFKVDDNPADLVQRLGRLIADTGAEVVPIDSAWVESGINFGSRLSVRIQPPKIAIAWDQPTGSYSAGALRYLFERRFGYPVSAVPVRNLSARELSRFQVVILPDGGFFGPGYGAVLGERGGKALGEWVSRGGTLVALGGAVSYLASENVALLGTGAEDLADAPAPHRTDEGRLFEDEEAYRDAIRASDGRLDSVAGVLLRAHKESEHFLTLGLPESTHVLFGGRRIYRPLTLDQGVNAMYFAGPDDVLASGYMWEENRKQVAFKPFVMHQRRGRGQVIGITQDPSPRAYQNGLDLLLINAAFRSVGHAQPMW